MKRIAYIVSGIFHPIVLFDLGIIFMIGENFSWEFSKIVQWAGFLAFLNILVISFIFWGMKTRRFSNFDVSRRKQRFFLYQAIIVLCVAFYLIGKSLGASPFIQQVSVVFLIFLILLEVINTRIKASVHMASLAIVSLAAALYYGGAFLLLILSIPLVAWARIYEKRHTPKEVIAGIVTGVLILVIGKFIIQ